MKRFNGFLFAATALAFTIGAQAPVSAQNAAPAAESTAAAPGHVVIGDFGIDLSARDLTTKPGDDFERYASGKWIDKTTIPADRASIGSFTDLRETVQAQMKDLITSAPANSKAGALYASFMDEKAIEQKGLKPLMADIGKVRAISNRSQMARFMGATNGKFGVSLINSYVDVDTENPTTNILYLTQSGLGLPDKDYYINPRFAPQR
jgi:putative endopeptidase